MMPEKKIRFSHQRERIYQYLLETTEHPTAEMIHDALRSEIKGLSLGTVYRNLRLLEDLGKVRRVALREGSDRYDAISGDHVHFLCERCHSLLDVEDADVDRIRKAAALSEDFLLSSVDLTLTGLCPQCIKEQTAEMEN